MAELSIQHKIFCYAYIKSKGNAKYALKEAGYKYTSLYARQITFTLMSRPSVRSYLNNLVKKMEEENGITLDWIYKKLKRAADVCIPDEEESKGIILDKGMTGVKAISEINKMRGNYAPTKTVSASVNINASAEIKEVDELIKLYEKEY